MAARCESSLPRCLLGRGGASFAREIGMKTALPIRLLAAVLLLSSTSTFAQQIGRVERTQGKVEVVRDGQTLAVGPGFEVRARDRVVVGAGGAMGIVTPDNGAIAVGPNSQLVVDAIAFNRDTSDGKIAVRFLKGTFAVVSGALGKLAPEKTNFRMPNSVIGIRGTEFSISIDVSPEAESALLKDWAPET